MCFCKTLGYLGVEQTLSWRICSVNCAFWRTSREGLSWYDHQARKRGNRTRVCDQLCSARKTPAAFCLSLLARNERGENRREGKLTKSASSADPKATRRSTGCPSYSQNQQSLGT